MAWRLWWIAKQVVEPIGFILVVPGAFLLDVADWCEDREQTSKRRAKKSDE